MRLSQGLLRKIDLARLIPISVRKAFSIAAKVQVLRTLASYPGCYPGRRLNKIKSTNSLFVLVGATGIEPVTR